MSELANGPRRVGVVGGGTMGTGIAYVFAAAGCEVTLVEPSSAQAAVAHRAILDRAAGAAERGKLPREAAERVAELLRTVPDVAGLDTGLDLVVESVPERLDLKRSVLALAEQRKPTLLASNTSGLPIRDVGSGLRDPDAVLGLHFFNPVWSMPLVEIVHTEATPSAQIDRARAAAALIGKETILVRDAPGFATSRLGVALGLEAIRMLEDGVAEAADIDKAMELGYRHPMGPLRLTDLVGLDVRLDIARNLAAAYGERFAPPKLLVDKVAAGEIGRKSGRGFYYWDDR
ncbi:MAG: 3-hydroxyacyl-CoA dehydrogenase family protein [Pseudonocardia sp.]|nr:3-hydroxyacyl-CoA dehydrogenase family protein [Pseudonocardia sp.]